LKRNYAGCAICDSTWGDHWEEVEGDRMFFCCALCAVQFQGLVARIRTETGWPALDEIVLSGDRRGRECTARCGGSTYRAGFAFNAEGAILRFQRLDPTG
jgi:putative zinc binding protein